MNEMVSEKKIIAAEEKKNILNKLSQFGEKFHNFYIYQLHFEN